MRVTPPEGHTRKRRGTAIPSRASGTVPAVPIRSHLIVFGHVPDSTGVTG